MRGGEDMLGSSGVFGEFLGGKSQRAKLRMDTLYAHPG